jgi:hypothetical protein
MQHSNPGPAKFSSIRRGPARRAFRPMSEALEGRSLLSTLSVSDAAVLDPSSGLAMMTFPVTLSAPSSQTVKVNYATIANGTAVGASTPAAGVNYLNVVGTLTFAPGQRSQTVSVTILAEPATRPDVNFTMALSSPSFATVARNAAVGTIVNGQQVVSPPTSRLTFTVPMTQIALTSNGQTLIALSAGGDLYTAPVATLNWTDDTHQSITMLGDGYISQFAYSAAQDTIIALSSAGYVYTAHVSNPANWSDVSYGQINHAGNGSVTQLAYSAAQDTIIVLATNGDLYTAPVATLKWYNAVRLSGPGGSVAGVDSLISYYFSPQSPPPSWLQILGF